MINANAMPNLEILFHQKSILKTHLCPSLRVPIHFFHLKHDSPQFLGLLASMLHRRTQRIVRNVNNLIIIEASLCLKNYLQVEKQLRITSDSFIICMDEEWFLLQWVFVFGSVNPAKYTISCWNIAKYSS